MIHPIVSVIIPTYNRTSYLKLTIESILQQTFQEFEILVIDDGTPNDENEVVCLQFEKVKYIKISNSGGPAKPRNIGIQNAKGKYLAFVDDDDLWVPEKLEKQVEILENNPDFGLTHCYCGVIDAKGNLKEEIVGRPKDINSKSGDVSMRMFGNWTIMMPTPLMRAALVDEVGYFNEAISGTFADVDYWVRCSFFTKFHYLDEMLVLYRLHENNISSDTKIYRKLPIHLKGILKEFLQKKIINVTQFKHLQSRLCINQINYIKQHYGVTLELLFKIDKFWFLRFKNLKSLTHNLFFKK